MTSASKFSFVRHATGVFAAIVLIGGLAGCSSNNDVDLANLVEQNDPADQLFNQGLANLNAGRLAEAAKKFDAVDRQHPYSEFARKSLVMGAFTQYRMNRYDEAILAAKRFLTLYPADAEAPYAQYIIGLAWYRQIRDVTTDQKEARKTIEAMDELVQRWPDSEYVEDAKTKIRFARDQMAGKEMQIGRYYLERREYTAAIKRFRIVVETQHIGLQSLGTCDVVHGIRRLVLLHGPDDDGHENATEGHHVAGQAGQVGEGCQRTVFRGDDVNRVVHVLSSAVPAAARCVAQKNTSNPSVVFGIIQVPALQVR